MLGRENELWLRDGRLKAERELPELLRGAELKLGRPEKERPEEDLEEPTERPDEPE